MPEMLENSSVTTQWMKIKDLSTACFVGQEAVAYGYGSHILFTNLTSGIDSYYRADSKQNGDGISCLAGHKVFSIFAFAELGWNGRIFILSYPDFIRISVLESKEPSLYISLSFSETEHLVALTGMPDYKIQVWYWRTQDLLVSKETELISDKQKISCSPSLPLTVCQLAYNKALLIVWEIHGTQRFSKLIKRSIVLPFDKKDAPCDICYSIEGNIHLVNKKGDIYNIIPSFGTVSLISKWNAGNGDISTCIAYSKGGILVSGPDGTLKYLKKQKYVWNEIFQKTPPEPFILLKGYHENDLTIGATTPGKLVKLIIDGQHIDFLRLKEYDCSFRYFSLLHPMGKHILTVNEENAMCVFCIESGLKVSSIPVAQQTCVKSNPVYPYVAVGDSAGSVILFSLINVERPVVLTEFHLSHFPIGKIIFSRSGECFVVTDEEFNVFVMKGVPGGRINVICHTKEDSAIFPESIFEKGDDGLILIAQKNSSEDSGTCLLKFTISLQSEVTEKIRKHEILLEKDFTKFINVPGNDDSLFYTSQLMSRNIEIIQIADDNSVKTVDVIETPHELKSFQFVLSGRYLYTWGTLDGLISIYDTRNNHEMIAKFVAHNRHTLGVRKAALAFDQFMVTLGHSKNIVCTKLDVAMASQFKATPEPSWKQMFAKETVGFVQTGENVGKKYLDLQTEQTFIMEVKESEETRKLVFMELSDLKERLATLLDKNEVCPLDEKLEIQDFNIDEVTTEEMIALAKKEREQERGRMLEFIKAQNQVNNWIIEKCWKTIAYKGSKLRGIFSRIFVENFAMLPEREENQMKKIQLMRKIENSVAYGDCFLPWRPIPSLDLEKIFAMEPTIMDLEDAASDVFPRQMNTLMGTNSHKCLEPSPMHYQQMDIISFHQMYTEKFIIEEEIREIKKQFNKKFEELKYAKKLDINSIKVKNDRLRNIHNEIDALNELKGIGGGKKSDFFIPDPQFFPDECPESSIVTVQDSEVTAAKYVTPSFQQLVKAERAAREQRRLELESDDFRERALDVMMDGVLEHRWEDEIKKSPKRPDCLLREKGSRDYNESEIKEIAEYEAKILFLEKERERYRVMLDEEEVSLQLARDEEIKLFNLRIGEMAYEKNKIDAAIAQEEMKLLMMTLYNFKRISYQQEEMRVRSKIEHVKELIEELTQMQTELQERITDIKNNYENLNAKDKQLDKQFKGNFSETAPAAPVDQAYKYFKRRPKLQMRAQITSPILQEMARRVTSKKVILNAKLLPTECLEYLNGIDSLDQIASSTTGIDSNSWQILCKMRRIKIESEFKIKGLGLQLADAETTSMAYSREINNKRNYLQTLEKSLVEMKENRENETINRFVQIVLKRGLIEIPLSGSFSDFHESVLIHRSDVDDINKIIKKAGAKKLKAMKNSAEFRRKIITKEWEHKVLKLKVRDLKEHVKTIEKCKITKEVQMWLKWKEKGWTEDLGEAALNREVENAINMQEKLLNEALKELTTLESLIAQKIRENKLLDKRIQMLNIDVAEKNFMRDVEFEKHNVRSARERMRTILERAKIVRIIQQQHTHILELTTLLELQRLKTYPTLSAHAHSTKFIKLNH